jgi:hypothetical protein
MLREDHPAVGTQIQNWERSDQPDIQVTKRKELISSPKTLSTLSLRLVAVLAVLILCC